MTSSPLPFAVVVLPTYNERENLPGIVGRIGASLAACPALSRHEILVVDDASPDGTGALADELAAADPTVAVLHRTTLRGLGPAYLDGIDHALGRGADLVIQMDADGSHDPASLPDLIAAATSTGVDVALGSRYTHGGHIENWSPFRRVLSRCASAFARTVLGLPLRDLTGGFRCHRASALQAIDRSHIRATGYGFLVELTWLQAQAGQQFREVPIVFRDRIAGQSKMSLRIAGEGIVRVLQLRFAPRG